jgi:hypothetical protein
MPPPSRSPAWLGPFSLGDSSFCYQQLVCPMCSINHIYKFPHNYITNLQLLYTCLSLWAHDTLYTYILHTNYSFSPSCFPFRSSGRSAGPDLSCQEQVVFVSYKLPKVNEERQKKLFSIPQSEVNFEPQLTLSCNLIELGLNITVLIHANSPRTNAHL